MIHRSDADWCCHPHCLVSVTLDALLPRPVNISLEVLISAPLCWDSQTNSFAVVLQGSNKCAEALLTRDPLIKRCRVEILSAPGHPRCDPRFSQWAQVQSHRACCVCSQIHEETPDPKSVASDPELSWWLPSPGCHSCSRVSGSKFCRLPALQGDS